MPSFTQTSFGVWTNGTQIIHWPLVADSGQAALTWEGWDFALGGKIEGVGGQGYSIFAIALSYIQAIPISPALLPGAALPGYPFATLHTYRIRPISVSVCEFEILYRQVGQPAGNVNLLEVDSSAKQVETNLDINGNRILVNWPASITDTTKQKQQTRRVSAFSPQRRIRVTRQELGGTPAIDFDEWEGSVNSGPCPWDAAAPARTWMFMGKHHRSRDQGITWEASYEFEKARVVATSLSGQVITGWDAVVSWIDPDNGCAPPDINVPPTVGNTGRSNNAYQIAPTNDFSAFAFLF